MNLETRLNIARRLVRKYWELACKHDGIPVSAKFVVFSDGNPYEGRRNLAMSLLQSYVSRLAHRGQSRRQYVTVLP